MANTTTTATAITVGPTDAVHRAIVARRGQCMTGAVWDGIGRHVTIRGALSVHDARECLAETLAPGELIASIATASRA